MVTKLIMPKLGETMEFGALIKWRKNEGDKIKRGDILFEVETDKAVFEHESTKSGLLRKITVPAGEGLVPVLVTVGYVADSMDEDVPEEAVTEKVPAKSETEPPEKSEEKKESAAAPSAVRPAGERIFISPLARNMAKEKGIDIVGVTGTGPNGRIVAKDIENYTPPAVGTGMAFAEKKWVKELSRVNKVVARRLSESKSTIPHFYLTQKINMSETVELRNKLKEMFLEKYNVKMTYTDIIIQALSLSLQKFENLNGTFKDNTLHLTNSVNIGIAASVDDELYVPVLKNSQAMNLGQIVRERSNIVEAVRNKNIPPDKLYGGTFTLSNLGNSGLAIFGAIINPPELAILATGSIIEEPVLDKGEIKAGYTMNVTLSCDHRAVNGVYGSQFLKYFQVLLESPYSLLLGGY